MATFSIDAVDKASSVISSVRQSVGGFRGALQGLMNIGQAVGQALRVATRVISAIGRTASKAVRSVLSLVDGFAKFSDDLAKNAARIGTSIEKLQQWRFVANRFGTSSDKMDKALKKLNRRFAEAKLGFGALRGLARKFPPVAEEIKKAGSASEFLKSLPGLFQQLESRGAKAAVAMKAMGRGGRDLINVFDRSPETIKALMKRFDELGGATEKAAARSERYVDAQTDLSRAVRNIKSRLSSALLPAMTLVVDAVTKAIGAAGDLIDAFSGTGEQTKSLSRIIFEFTQSAIVSLLQAFDSLINQIGNAVEVVAPFSDMISTTINVFGDLGRAVIAASSAIDAAYTAALQVALEGTINLIRGIERFLQTSAEMAVALGRGGLAKTLRDATLGMGEMRSKLDILAEQMGRETSAEAERLRDTISGIGEEDITSDQIKGALDTIKTASAGANQQVKQLVQQIERADFEGFAPTETDPGQAGGGAPEPPSPEAGAEESAGGPSGPSAAQLRLQNRIIRAKQRGNEVERTKLEFQKRLRSIANQDINAEKEKLLVQRAQMKMQGEIQKIQKRRAQEAKRAAAQQRKQITNTIGQVANLANQLARIPALGEKGAAAMKKIGAALKGAQGVAQGLNTILTATSAIASAGGVIGILAAVAGVVASLFGGSKSASGQASNEFSDTVTKSSTRSRRRAREDLTQAFTAALEASRGGPASGTTTIVRDNVFLEESDRVAGRINEASERGARRAM